MLIAKSEEKGGVDAINVVEVDLEEEAMEIIIMEECVVQVKELVVLDLMQGVHLLLRCVQSMDTVSAPPTDLEMRSVDQASVTRETRGHNTMLEQEVVELVDVEAITM